MNNLVLSGIVGSRAFGFHNESSDVDKMGVYVDTFKNMCKRDFKPFKQENNGTYYEIGYYIDLLERGELLATQLLFLDHYEFNLLPELREHRNDLLTRSTLQNWLYLSSVYYSKAIRLGKLKFEDKSPLDFMTFYPPPNHDKNTINEPFTTTVLRGSFYPSVASDKELDLAVIGLKKIDENFYNVYLDWKRTGDTKGLLNEKGEIIEDGLNRVSPYVSLVGMLKYDKKAYKKYISAQNEINKSKIFGGYATKSMMHAFRLIEMIGQYLDTSVLSLKVIEPNFFNRIRKGDIALEDLKQGFSELFEATERKLSHYHKDLDPDLLPIILEEARKKYNREVESRWAL